MNPAVSVVTVTKNLIESGQSRYLRECISSVRRQGTDSFPVEYIVVDGASNDGTKELIGAFEKQIDILISEPDAGIYDAMMKGVRLARGEYVAFLNADDCYLLHGLRNLVTATQSANADIGVGSASIVDENKDSVGLKKVEFFKTFFQAPFCHQALIVRRTCFDQVALDTTYEITAWKYMLDLYISDLNRYVSDLRVVKYRRGGISDRRRGIFDEERDRVVRECILNCSNHDLICPIESPAHTRMCMVRAVPWMGKVIF
jgi:glycosyltransferase involved in cell wall biosynthesis